MPEDHLKYFMTQKNICDDQQELLIGINQLFITQIEAILRLVPECADRTAAIRYLRLSRLQIFDAIIFNCPEEKEKPMPKKKKAPKEMKSIIKAKKADSMKGLV